MPLGIEHVKEITARAHAEGVYHRLKGAQRVAIFIRHLPLVAGSELRIGRKKYKVDSDSYLVFVDLMHDANFAHPVVYELHNVHDGSVRTIEEQFPIADVEMERSLVPHILPRKKEG